MFLYEEVIPLDDNGNFLCFTRPHAGFESDEYREIRHAYAWVGSLKTRVLEDVFPLLSMPIPADLELAKMLLQASTMKKARANGQELTVQQKESIEKSLFRARLLSKPSRAIPELVLPANNGQVLTICRNKTQVKGEIRHRFLMRLVDVLNKSVLEQLDVEGDDSVLEKIKAIGNPLAINPDGSKALFWSNGNVYIADTRDQFKPVKRNSADFSSKCATWCDNRWIATRTNIKKNSSIIYLLDGENATIDKEYFVDGIVVGLHAAKNFVLVLLQDGSSKILNVKSGEMDIYRAHKDVPRMANVMGYLSSNAKQFVSWTDSEHLLMVTDVDNVKTKKYGELPEVKSLIHKGKNGEIHKVLKPTATFIGNYLISVSNGRITYLKNEASAAPINFKLVKAPPQPQKAAPEQKAQDLDSKIKRNLSLEEVSQSLNEQQNPAKEEAKENAEVQPKAEEIDTSGLSLADDSNPQPPAASTTENNETAKEAQSEVTSQTKAEELPANETASQAAKEIAEPKLNLSLESEDAQAQDAVQPAPAALSEPVSPPAEPVHDSLSEDLSKVEVHAIPEAPQDAGAVQDSLSEDLSQVDVEPLAEEPVVVEDTAADTSSHIEEQVEAAAEAKLAQETEELTTDSVEDSLSEDLTQVEVHALSENPAQEDIEITDEMESALEVDSDQVETADDAEQLAQGTVDDSAPIEVIDEEENAISLETKTLDLEETQPANDASLESPAAVNDEDVQGLELADHAANDEDAVSDSVEMESESAPRVEAKSSVDTSLLDELNSVLGYSDEKTEDDSAETSVSESQTEEELPVESEVAETPAEDQAEEQNEQTVELMEFEEPVEPAALLENEEGDGEANLEQEDQEAESAEQIELQRSDAEQFEPLEEEPPQTQAEAESFTDSEDSDEYLEQDGHFEIEMVGHADDAQNHAQPYIELDEEVDEPNGDVDLESVELEEGPVIGMSYETDIPEESHEVRIDDVDIEEEEISLSLPDEDDTEEEISMHGDVDIDEPDFVIDYGEVEEADPEDNIEHILGQIHHQNGNDHVSIENDYNHSEGLIGNLAKFDLVSAKEMISAYYSQGVSLEIAAAELILPVGSSKIGGKPDLPEEFEWPQYGELPMAFVAQVNLTQLKQVHPDSPLPKEGLLSFFIGINPEYNMPMPNHAEEPMWRVVHHNLQNLKPRDIPEFPESVINSNFSEAEINLVLQSEGLPDTNSVFFEQMGLNEQQQVLYMGLYQAIETERVDRKLAGHELHNKLLGYPEYISLNNMEAQCAKAFDDALTKEEARKMALDWMLLLQLDSDSQDSEFFWGDGGMLYWFIRRSDLAKGCFDNTWIIIQQ